MTGGGIEVAPDLDFLAQISLLSDPNVSAYFNMASLSSLSSQIYIIIRAPLIAHLASGLRSLTSTVPFGLPYFPILTSLHVQCPTLHLIFSHSLLEIMIS